MSEGMTRTVEVTHAGFLRKITGNKAWRNTNGMQEILAAGEVLRAAGMHKEATYISRSQGTVLQWVDLHPIFDVCSQEQGF